MMTIYALSTAQGRAGVAVIRISGPASGEALQVLCQRPVPPPRTASLRSIRDPQTGDIIDKGLVLLFPAPATFTGEDMVELHVHGGRAVIAGALEALSKLGLRMAEPGEFTRRAFENGKIDLTEAEGLADLINAETASQRRQALNQATGALRARFDVWRSALLRAMAYMEASLDFADEGDIAADAIDRSVSEAQNLADALKFALADSHRGEIIRDGIQVAILGPPNVGKSSLLNAIAGREAAIVFDEPGTTRDVIEVSVDLGGFPFVFRDTAGLRETDNAVEQEGIRRALGAARQADIILLVEDGSGKTNESDHVGGLERHTPPAFTNAASEDLSDLSSVPSLRAADLRSRTFFVLNKIDLASETSTKPTTANASARFPISAKTGEGLEVLKSALVSFARDTYGGSDPALITRVRHRHEIERAELDLREFLRSIQTGEPSELSAELLRSAADALGRLTGRLDVEDVLGQIFSEFCIGK